MEILRTQNLVPSVYENESRDFQLVSRIFDVVFNSVRNDIESMTDIVDTGRCRLSTLSLLKDKLGFFTDERYADDVLRYLLYSFSNLIREKGTLQCIRDAVYVFLNAYGIKADGIYIDTLTGDRSEIQISIQTRSRIDTIKLDGFLRYFLPTGARASFVYIFSTATASETEIRQSNSGSNSVQLGNAYSGDEYRGSSMIGDNAVVGVSPVGAEDEQGWNINATERDFGLE